MKFTMSKADYTRHCEVCGYDLMDVFYLQVGTKKIHTRCLKCRMCLSSLSSESSCYEKHGEMYCKICYQKSFTLPNCMGCKRRIVTSDFVMQAKNDYYHVNCFRCSFCASLLQKGHKFGVRHQQLLCEEHYFSNTPETRRNSSESRRMLSVSETEEYNPLENDLNPSIITTVQSNLMKNAENKYETVPPNEKREECVVKNKEYNYPFTNKVQDRIDELMLPCFTNTDNTHNEISALKTKGNYLEQPKNEEIFLERKISAFSPSTSTIPCTIVETSNEKTINTQSLTPDSDVLCSFSSSTSEEDDHKFETAQKPHKERKSRSKDGKPKRIRTTFKQSQLIAMKQLFDKEKNPDSKLIQLLSEEVGLKKRILQVWFQNARAKHRKGQCILTIDKVRVSTDEKEEHDHIVSSTDEAPCEHTIEPEDIKTNPADD